MIIHGGITVNGKVCNTPGCFLVPGDTVKINAKFQYMVYKQLYTTNFVKKPVCPFLEVNYNTLTCFILSMNQDNKTSTPYQLENHLSLLNFISLR
jgi:ribosomal protein S4